MARDRKRHDKPETTMPSPRDGNSFSWGDALFLYIEREGQPLNIAGVSVFEGKMKRADVMKFITAKLPRIPRFCQRVVFPPLDLGLPRWEMDRNFDIRNHIREVKLKHGTEQELKALAGKIVSARLDRQRPLWDFTLVRLQGNRTGMVARMHHCLTDGIAGVGSMNVIMDTTPTPAPQPLPHKPARVEPPTPKDAGAVLLNGLLKSYSSLVEGALTLHSGLLNMAQEAVAHPAAPPAEMIRMVSELAAPAERLPFNIVCQGPQKFAWAELRLDEIKAVKNACETTVNDVVLAVVTSAFARYASLRGVQLKGRSLRIVIPVNVRGDGSTHEMGNQISFVPVAVPLDIDDPVKLLAEVHQRVEFLKRSHAAELVGMFGGALSTLPSAFWSHIGPVASQLPLSLCNTICTNVPGPQVPLYLMGHKMLAWYPWVPIGGLMGINCAILTYNGTAFFGFTGDVHAAPDLERLEKFVDVSFEELKKAVASGAAAPQPRKRERPNARIPLSKTPAKSRRRKAPVKVAPATPEAAAVQEQPTEEQERQAMAVSA